MLVKMLEDRFASIDGGATTTRLMAGDLVDLPEDLALRYLERGRAELPGGAPAPAELEEPPPPAPAAELEEEPAEEEAPAPPPAPKRPPARRKGGRA